MKKTALFLLLPAMALGFMASCENDDTDFGSYALTATDDEDDDDVDSLATDTIHIEYLNSSVNVSRDAKGYVTAQGADVTLTDTESARGLVLVLSGSTADGSLLINRSRKFTIVLNGVSIINADGLAINNQCGKSLYIVCADNTVNTLTDGTTYAERDYDQKGTLFSEGQIYFSGTGTLNVNANSKNAIASDDYITIEGDVTINCTTAQTASNGIKVNDGMFIDGGRLTVIVAADGGRGIRCDARTIMTGGEVSITTTGDCLIETLDGVADTTSAACIKCDSLFAIRGGTMTLNSSGDGGKGIRCNENIEISGGKLVATTAGDNKVGKPKALKSDTGIIVSGGSLVASVSKSWACDNGTESEDPEEHLTILNTPKVRQVDKKYVEVSY